MKKTYCDLCKKEIELPKYKFLIKADNGCSINSITSIMDGIEYDLCDDCKEKIMTYVNDIGGDYVENIEKPKYYVCKKTGFMCNISSCVWELGCAREIAEDGCFIKSYENSDTGNRISDFCKHLGDEYNG